MRLRLGIPSLHYQISPCPLLVWPNIFICLRLGIPSLHHDDQCLYRTLLLVIDPRYLAVHCRLLCCIRGFFRASFNCLMYLHLRSCRTLVGCTILGSFISSAISSDCSTSYTCRPFPGSPGTVSLSLTYLQGTCWRRTSQNNAWKYL